MTETKQAGGASPAIGGSPESSELLEPLEPLERIRSIQTVGGVLAARAAIDPDRLAVVAPDAASHRLELTYRRLHDEARRVARALLGAGVQRGDRVAIWAPNIVEWITVYYGIQLAGAVLVPINTRFRGREAAHVLRNSEASILFTVSGFLNTDYLGWLRTATAHESLPNLREVVLLRGELEPGARSLSDFLAGASVVAESALDERTAQITPADASDISYTSGTTGTPKGAIASHAQVCGPFGAWADVVGVRRDDRFLLIPPFFHSLGSKAGFFVATLVGACVYPQLRFDVDACLDLIESDAITIVPAPPAVFLALLAQPTRSERDLRSLRVAVTGSSDVPTEMVVAMRDDLGFDYVITGYGLTESSGVATMCRYTDPPEVVARTAGRAIPGVEVAIIGAGGRFVPTGERGEVVVRGYNVMPGYWRDPVRTAETLVDGWLRTGDVGALDDDGYLTITGRLKDMYVRGGENVYPVEVEQLLASHPAVRDVAVVGVSDPRFGEVGMAFVVPQLDKALDEAGFLAWAREQMANYKVPQYVEFVDELPRNASAKVRKTDLKAAGEQRLQPAHPGSGAHS